MGDIDEILAKKTVTLQPPGIQKFFDIVRTMESVISLGVGEPDFDTPWPIREEDVYSLERRYAFYTGNAGLNELREEIARYIQRRSDVSYEPLNEITVTIGGSEGIDLACHTMLDPDDEVIISQPSYVSYEPCVCFVDGVPVIVELEKKDRSKLMPESLGKTTTPRTRFLVLSFPDNPTGSIMTGEELAAIAEVATRHDLYVISNGIYTEPTYSGEAPASIIRIPGMREKTVLINDFSRAYVVTDWRLGYACGPEPILRQMIRVHQCVTMCAPTTSQYTAATAPHDCDVKIARTREAYNQRRRYLLKRLEEVSIPCSGPEGTFYIPPNISKFGMSSEEFYTELLTEEKVAVVPGTTFGQSGEGFARISYAYSLRQLREAMGRIQRFVERYAN